jgi:putative membrane protein
MGGAAFMSSVGQAVLLSWSVPPAASFALAMTAAIYLRGWFLMRRARVPFVPAWRAICFLLGLLTLWIALASPLDTFSAFIVTAHMLQHMLLMMVAPPLILLGAPLIPLVRGLPVFAAREFAGPFLNWRIATRVGSALTNLFVALVLMGVVMLGWHTPQMYELALASSSWHEVEHACFFVASLIFWWPVVQPWPSRAQAPRWALVPYLLIADLQNTILSAILVFSDRVLYPSYGRMPRLFGLSAMQDQAASGAIMWVLGSVAFLIPAMIIAVQYLSGTTMQAAPQPMLKAQSSGWVSQPILRAHGWLQRRLGGSKLEAITFILLFATAGVSLAWLASRPSDDDDQVLRMRPTSGTFAVAVFAAEDLQTGANNFSVLVQDRNTQEVLRDATVNFRARQGAAGRETTLVRAETDNSENKLLQSADLELPSAGDWSLLINVHRGSEAAEFAVPLKVVKPDGGFAVPWPYTVLLVFSAVLLFIYVRRHRQPRADRQHESLAQPLAEAHADELVLTRKT